MIFSALRRKHIAPFAAALSICLAAPQSRAATSTDIDITNPAQVTAIAGQGPAPTVTVQEITACFHELANIKVMPKVIMYGVPLRHHSNAGQINIVSDGWGCFVSPLGPEVKSLGLSAKTRDIVITDGSRRLDYSTGVDMAMNQTPKATVDAIRKLYDGTLRASQATVSFH